MKKVFFVICSFTIISSCANGQSEDFDKMLYSLYKNTVSIINPNELMTYFQNDSLFFLLDSREMNEYNISHLKNARYVGYDDFKVEKIKDIPMDAKVIVYCSVGYRSERIGEKLNNLGYKNILNLYGGIFKWVNMGFPIYNNNKQETYKVHAYSKKWGKWLTEGEKIYDK